MFDQTQMKQLIQAAEQAWFACAHQICLIRGCPDEQNIAHQTREQKEMFYVFDGIFDGLQILSNTIKYDQTRSNNTKQGVQKVKYLVTKQCLMVFGRQTFIFCPGPLRADCLESKVTSGSDFSIYFFGYLRASRRRLKFARHSSNVVFEEFVLSSLIASPLIEPLFTPGGWHELKWVYSKVSVGL